MKKLFAVVLGFVLLGVSNAQATLLNVTYNVDNIFATYRNDTGSAVDEFVLNMPASNDSITLDFGDSALWNVFDIGNNYLIESRIIPLGAGGSVDFRLTYDTTDINSPYFGMNLALFADRQEADLNMYTAGGSYLGTNYLQVYTLPQSGPGSPVPEPATMLLFGTGLAGLAGSRLRSKKKS